MDKIITIHQPESFPYIGFFSKMSASHEFVILDSVQFTKNNFQNRNRILHQGRPKWLTLPVNMEGHLDSRILDMQIANTVDWRSRTIKAITDAYRDCEFFDEHAPALCSIIRNSNDSLVDFNMEIILYLRECLDITTPLTFSSDMDLEGHKSDLVLDICKKSNAQVYLSGHGGKGYMDIPKFTENGIQVGFQEYDSTIPYKQKDTQEFIPYMSTIDLIMNNSKEDSKNYLISACTYDFS